jgi:hypothetical protein
MSVRQVRLAVFLLYTGLFLFAGHGEAAPPKLVDVSNLEAPVTQGSPTTYFDLLKLIFPDLYQITKEAPDAIATQTALIRHIDRDYAETSLEGNIKFTSFTVSAIHSQNRPLLLLLIDTTIETKIDGNPNIDTYSLLALFQNGRPPKLLDLLDIKTDHLNGFWTENPIIKLNPGNEAVLVYSNHFNTNQNYTIVRMLSVERNHLEQICDVFSFDYKTQCETFRSKPVFWTVPDAAHDYPKVVAAVNLKMESNPKECKPRITGYTKSFRAEFQWDNVKKQYKETSGNLEKLVQFYEKHF